MKLQMRTPGGERRAEARRNVGSPERWISMLAGGAALAAGARRRDAFGAVLCIAGGYALYRGASGHCAAYAALRRSTVRAEDSGLWGAQDLSVHTKIMVDRPREMVYRYWRALDNLPNFMSHLKEVRTYGNRSHWVARGPVGMTADWDAEITHDTPNERLAWRSLPGSPVETRGEIRFRPASIGEGTEVEVDMRYRLPAGRLGRWLGGASEQMIRRDLGEFKRMIEQQASPLPDALRDANLDQGLGRATVTPAHG